MEKPSQHSSTATPKPKASKRGAPIGVFDSGLGGLTVVRALRRILPNENIVYLGDTARVPYGTKSAETVIRYAQGCSTHLLEHEIKVLVIACNTVSAVALETLQASLDIPVIGVIEPGSRAAALETKTHRVGVLATAGTVGSNAYPRALEAANERIECFQTAAPLLVPLVEEGWTSGEVPELAARKYLKALLDQEIDTLVLGCTHYPLLRPLIQKVCNESGHPGMAIVDSGEACSLELKQLLMQQDLANEPSAVTGSLHLLVTDRPRAFRELAERFLHPEGTEIRSFQVSSVDL